MAQYGAVHNSAFGGPRFGSTFAFGTSTAAGSHSADTDEGPTLGYGETPFAALWPALDPFEGVMTSLWHRSQPVRHGRTERAQQGMG